jgi:hypothetical protein
MSRNKFIAYYNPERDLDRLQQIDEYLLFQFNFYESDMK